ncbi:MAG: hypothetical protein JSW06_05410 [Thermoplasmatales archaeon]|nr:MAG: hypothetical protein JSW06_05410 [Thermoplasmatales archaeon]
MNMKDVNEWTILSLLAIIAGIIFYVYWGITYGVWADVGIYSITIVLVLVGFFGILLSFHPEKEE